MKAAKTIVVSGTSEAVPIGGWAEQLSTDDAMFLIEATLSVASSLADRRLLYEGLAAVQMGAAMKRAKGFVA